MKKFYFFYLEIALKKKNDLNIYASINISHIPTSKLIEIFNMDIDNDPYLVEPYMLTKTLYKKHKKYITENIGPMNFDIFQYSILQFVAEDPKEIRKFYKEDFME